MTRQGQLFSKILSEGQFHLSLPPCSNTELTGNLLISLMKGSNYEWLRPLSKKWFFKNQGYFWKPLARFARPFFANFLKEAPLQNDLLWVFWHEVKTENNRGQWERHFFCSFKESEQEGIYCAGLSPLNTIARFISDIFLEFLLFAHFSNFE